MTYGVDKISRSLVQSPFGEGNVIEIVSMAVVAVFPDQGDLKIGS